MLCILLMEEVHQKYVGYVSVLVIFKFCYVSVGERYVPWTLFFQSHLFSNFETVSFGRILYNVWTNNGKIVTT
jgi:hypothetical protein